MNQITKLHLAAMLTLCALLSLLSVTAQAQSTTFTYQGRLTDNNGAANGTYDFQFGLFDAVSGGVQVGTTNSRTNVPVTNGTFTVSLDFGAGSFPGTARFLEISVRLAAPFVNYTTLSPRQPVTSTPYAIQSLNAVTATSFSGALAGDVTGTQAATALSNNAVTTAKLADGSVTTAKHADGSVTTAKIADANVTDAKIATVSGSKITGTIPVAGVPAGSTNYIQNGTALQASSNFNISGNGFFGGNVGIGTTAPADSLHVVGVGTAIRATDGAVSTRLFSSAANGKGSVGTLTNHAFTLRTSDADRVTIDASGKVGIGTTNPTTKLDVNGFLTVRDNNNQSYLGGIATESFAQAINFGINDFWLGNPSYSSQGGILRVDTRLGANLFQFLGRPDIAAPDVSLLEITSSGKVGIGTAAPGSKLSVAGVIESTSGGIKFPDGTTQASAVSASNFIQNGTALQASSNFNISGFGQVQDLRAARALSVDTAGLFDGNFGAAVGGRLGFGGSGIETGEGIASKRTATGNAFGLDFYTSYTPRLSITNSGNVGIGTMNPLNRLTVAAPSPKATVATTRAFAITTNDTYVTPGSPNNPFGLDVKIMGAAALSDRAVIFQTSDFDTGDGGNIVLQGNMGNGVGGGGNVGIGVMAPLYKLDVGGFAVFRAGTGGASDARWKQHIQTLDHALDKVQRLRGVSFYWRSHEYPEMGFDERPQIGFIAQELIKVLPELVHQDAQGFYSVNYSAVIPVLVEGMKEQQALIKTLQTEKEVLNARLAALEQLVQQLKEQVEKQPQPKQQ